MASQTFTVSEEVFQRFAAVVPEGNRSSVVSKLLEKEVQKREQKLISACEAANKNAHLKKVESDLGQLEDTVSEPFDSNEW